MKSPHSLDYVFSTHFPNKYNLPRDQYLKIVNSIREIVSKAQSLRWKWMWDMMIAKRGKDFIAGQKTYKFNASESDSRDTIQIIDRNGFTHFINL